MLLAIQYAIWICFAINFIFMGLNASVWQDAPPTFIFISHGIVLLLGTALIFIKPWLEKWTGRKVDMLLEQWPIERKRARKFRKLCQMLIFLVAVTFIVVGVSFRNLELSLTGGGGLVFIIMLYIIDALVERAEKCEQREGNDTNDTDDTKE